MHLTKRYAGGIGHIESRENGFLVSFYGRRVAQEVVQTVQEARALLRAMARDPHLAR